MADQGVQRRSRRVRRAVETATDAGSSGEQAGASTAQRPTPAELQEALEVIHMMKAPWRERDPPILAKQAPAKPNVVACAIAMCRRERKDPKSGSAGGVDVDGNGWMLVYVTLRWHHTWTPPSS